MINIYHLLMINNIHQEDIINTYAPNIEIPKYIKK